MASIYGLKPKFQDMLRPVSDGLWRTGVTANAVTVAGVVISLAAGAAVGWARGGRMLLVLPAVLFVRMALNAIDGMMAREHDQKTALGAVLNELGDVVADAGLYLPLALVAGFDWRLVVVVVVLAMLTEMVGVVAVQIGATRRYDGPMGKSDRAFVFGVMALLLGCGVRMERGVRYVLLAMIALLVATVLRRARRALQEVAQG